MFSVDLTFGAVLYTACALLVFFALGFYYDRRDRRLYDATRRKATFHCLKCGQVYTAPAREVSACPACGHENPRLRF